MKTKLLLCTSFVSACLLAVLTLSTSQAAPAIEAKTLIQSSAAWEGTAFTAYPAGSPELTLVKLKIPANTALPWHAHPVPNAVYVLSGEVTIEIKDGKSQLFKQGQALPEVVDIVHRGKTGDMPAELLVFYAGSKGIPLQR